MVASNILIRLQELNCWSRPSHFWVLCTHVVVVPLHTPQPRDWRNLLLRHYTVDVYIYYIYMIYDDICILPYMYLCFTLESIFGRTSCIFRVQIGLRHKLKYIWRALENSFLYFRQLGGRHFTHRNPLYKACPISCLFSLFITFRSH